MFSVIFGAGGQGRETLDLLLRQGHLPSELLFCESSPTAKLMHGIELVSFTDLVRMKSEVSWIHVALGNPNNRAVFVNKFKAELLPLGSIETQNNSVR